MIFFTLGETVSLLIGLIIACNYNSIFLSHTLRNDSYNLYKVETFQNKGGNNIIIWNTILRKVSGSDTYEKSTYE